jgi:hypothetical protein
MASDPFYVDAPGDFCRAIEGARYIEFGKRGYRAYVWFGLSSIKLIDVQTGVTESDLPLRSYYMDLGRDLKTVRITIGNHIFEEEGHANHKQPR